MYTLCTVGLGIQPLLHTRFTVGLGIQPLFITRFTVGLGIRPLYHPFRCWAENGPSNHPFHCWARYGTRRGGIPYLPTMVPPSHTRVYMPPYVLFTHSFKPVLSLADPGVHIMPAVYTAGLTDLHF